MRFSIDSDYGDACIDDSVKNDSPNNGRRAFMFLTGAVVFASALPSPRAEAEERDREKQVTLESLPKGPEDVYLLLFENNPSDERSDDDFIAGAAEAAGYSAPFQWHVEIMYFHPQHKEWMIMGCRPPRCSMDYPASDLLSHHRGHTVRVNHLKVSVKKQKEAREFFTRQFQGRKYALAGPSKTNCSDVPAAMSNKLGVGNVRTFTRSQLAGLEAIREFLRRHGSTLDEVLQRDDLIFPDAFENVGRRLGILRF